jgi:hypothetical protein
MPFIVLYGCTEDHATYHCRHASRVIHTRAKAERYAASVSPTYKPVIAEIPDGADLHTAFKRAT